MTKLLMVVLLLLPVLLRATETKGFADKRAVEQTTKVPVDAVLLHNNSNESQQLYNLGGDKRVMFISAGRLNYQDTNGTWQPIDLSEKTAKTKGFSKRVEVGQSVFEYVPGGLMKWSKGESSFTIKPANFDTTIVRIEQNWHDNGLKEYIYLSDKSPSLLVWTLEESEKGLAERRIDPFRAWDKDGKPVILTVVFTDNSLIVSGKDIAVLDPSVSDTASAGTMSGQMISNNSGTWATDRNATWATDFTSTGVGGMVVGVSANSLIYRAPIGFVLTALDSSVSVDSARIYSTMTEGVAAGDTIEIFFVEGTSTGGVMDSTWWSLFDGRAASGAHTITSLTIDTLFWVNGDEAVQKSTLLSAAGVTLLEDAMGDSLRIVALSNEDVVDDSTAGVYAYWPTDDDLSIAIYYRVVNPAGVTTTGTSDINQVTLTVDISIDSTGGVDCTGIGLEIMVLGNTADTTAVDSTGTFGVGSYSVLTGLVPPDTVLNVRATVTNANSKSYGSWKELSTTTTSASIQLNVMNVEGTSGGLF